MKNKIVTLLLLSILPGITSLFSAERAIVPFDPSSLTAQQENTLNSLREEISKYNLKSAVSLKKALVAFPPAKVNAILSRTYSDYKMLLAALILFSIENQNNDQFFVRIETETYRQFNLHDKAKNLEYAKESQKSLELYLEILNIIGNEYKKHYDATPSSLDREKIIKEKIKPIEKNKKKVLERIKKLRSKIIPKLEREAEGKIYKARILGIGISRQPKEERLSAESLFNKEYKLKLDGYSSTGIKKPLLQTDASLIKMVNDWYAGEYEAVKKSITRMKYRFTQLLSKFNSLEFHDPNSVLSFSYPQFLHAIDHLAKITADDNQDIKKLGDQFKNWDNHLEAKAIVLFNTINDFFNEEVLAKKSLSAESTALLKKNKNLELTKLTKKRIALQRAKGVLNDLLSSCNNDITQTVRTVESKMRENFPHAIQKIKVEIDKKYSTDELIKLAKAKFATEKSSFSLWAKIVARTTVQAKKQTISSVNAQIDAEINWLKKLDSFIDATRTYLRNSNLLEDERTKIEAMINSLMGKKLDFDTFDTFIEGKSEPTSPTGVGTSLLEEAIGTGVEVEPTESLEFLGDPNLSEDVIDPVFEGVVSSEETTEHEFETRRGLVSEEVKQLSNLLEKNKSRLTKEQHDTFVKSIRKLSESGAELSKEDMISYANNIKDAIEFDLKSN